MSQFFNTSTSGSPSNPVSPTNGGTGVSNPPAHTVPVAEGSAPFNFVGPGAVGTVLIGNGASADPSFSANPTVTSATATGTFQAANGTVAAPSYTFTNSLNVGIYRPAGNTLSIATNGTDAIVVNGDQSVQIANGYLYIQHGLVEKYTATAISYTVLISDIIIGVTSTAAVRTITLPNSSLTSGQRITIKDESGAAATNNITVAGNGANIDGAANKIINTNFGSVDLYYNGTNWFTI